MNTNKIPNLQSENLLAAQQVIKFLKDGGSASITKCQEVMWDNKDHINGRNRRFPRQYWDSIDCPRGKGLPSNYRNIWKWLYGNGLITSYPHPTDKRITLIKLI